MSIFYDYSDPNKSVTRSRILEAAQSNFNLTMLSVEELRSLKSIAQNEVMEKVPQEYLGQYRNPKAKEIICRQIQSTIERQYPEMPTSEKKRIAERITNEISGYGILEKYLNDSEITEILVERYDKITIEKNGTLTVTEDKFDSEDDLKLVIERIIIPTGRRLDWASPMVNTRLPDGSRICAIMPPVSPDGRQISIRKFKPNISMEQLVEFGALNEEIMESLKLCIKGRLSIIVSGGTGSGKSTFLNALSPYINHDLSIITIEDPMELQFNHPHVRRWEARPYNLEGKGGISMMDLVITALRSRPDIIIIGEVRGAEAYALMQALNTGHLGSMTTLHANNPHEAMKRLVSMVASARELSSELIPSYISGSVDLIVQLNRMPDGSRKVTEISEVIGDKDGQILTQPLIKYQQEDYDGIKVKGNWIRTEYEFKRLKYLKERGINEPVFQIK